MQGSRANNQPLLLLLVLLLLGVCSLLRGLHSACRMQLLLAMRLLLLLLLLLLLRDSQRRLLLLALLLQLLHLCLLILQGPLQLLVPGLCTHTKVAHTMDTTLQGEGQEAIDAELTITSTPAATTKTQP